MQFILTGFTQDMGFREFAFERMGADRIRTKYTVRADLALMRRYGIRLQELPLMCRGLLERRDEGEENSTLTFTEDEMSLYAKACVAPHKRKSPRRVSMDNMGVAWRVA